MPLTVDELLIPRFIVRGTKEGTKNYPKSPFLSGQIIAMKRKTTRFPIMGENNSENWETDIDKKGGGFDLYSITFFEEFPSLFHPLEWWEMRTPEQMPDYVKNNAGAVYKVLRMSNIIKGFVGGTINGNSGYFSSYSGLLPATEAEYLQQKNESK